MSTQNKIKNEFELDQHSDSFNEGTKNKQEIHEIYNSAYNHKALMQRIKDGSARDVSYERQKNDAKGAPFFLFGSGPTLDDILPKLKSWKHGIFISTSHAVTCMYYGIEPTHLVCLDPFCMWSEINGIDWSKTKTKLVCHPGIWPDLIENWPNEILLFRQNSGRADSFYATTQNFMYSSRTGSRQEDKFDFELHIPTHMAIFSTTPPAQLFMADALGYGTAFLAGLDFGYTDEKVRFTEYSVTKHARTVQTGNAPPSEIPPEFRAHPMPFDKVAFANLREQDQLVLSEDGIYTTGINIFYKKNFLSSWRLSLKTIYTTSKMCLPEIPFMPIDRILIKQGKASVQKPEWIKKVTERYLARQGAYVIETEDGGCNFIESPKNPEHDLDMWMQNMRKQFICPVCGLGAVNENPDGEEVQQCPRCKQANFQPKHKIDLPKNLTRIYVLHKYAKETNKKAGVKEAPTPAS